MAKGKMNQSEETAEAGQQPVEGLTNKMEAMRRALAELSTNASAAELQEFLKDRFNLEMSSKMVSTYKSTLIKKGKTPGKKRGPKPKHEASAAPAPTAGKDNVSLNDLRVVRELAHRMGPRQFRELVALLCP